MSQRFSDKLNDYTKYAETARRHFENGLYSDCAANCRKAGEAVCKVILFHRYTEKVAHEKMDNKSMKELILVLIKNQLAERKLINWLESIQIIGNKAAHDNEIYKDEALYSIKALDFITYWLFIEFIKTPIPKRLLETLKSLPTTKQAKAEPTVVEKIIIQETIIKENNEDILSRLKEIETKNKDQSSYQELLASINEAKQNIEQIKSTTQIEQKRNISGRGSKKWFFIVGCGIIVLIVGVAGVLNIKSDKKAAFTITNKNPDSLYIGIYNLNVMQENPNINFKIEEILENHILQYAREFSLPISVRKVELNFKNFNRDDSVVTFAKKTGFDLIYFGNLYESALKEENQISIKSFVCKGNNHRVNDIKFTSLTDSSIIKELKDQSNMALFLYCNNRLSESKGDELMPVLNTLTCFSPENKYSRDEFICEFYRKKKNYRAVVSGINKILTYYSGDNAYLFASKANAFSELTMYDSAKVYFKKSLAKDSTNFNTLVNYGRTLYKIVDTTLAYHIFLKAQKLNPNTGLVNYGLARINFDNGRYSKAKSFALQAFKYDKSIIENNRLLGETYAFGENKQDSAEYFFGLALGKDSSNTEVLNRLAMYYITFKPSKSSFSKYLLNKATRQSKSSEITNIYGRGITAFDDGNYKSAIPLLEKSYAANFVTSDLFTSLSKSYFHLGNKKKSLEWIKKGYDYDSTDVSTCFFYAYMLSYVVPEKDKFIIHLFEKITKAYPDIETYRFHYIDYIYRKGKIQEAINMALVQYNKRRTDYLMNKVLANLYFELGDGKNAKPYFEYLNVLKPNNDTIMEKLAQCIFITNPQLDSEFARGASLAKKAADMNSNNVSAALTACNYFKFGRNMEQAKKYYLMAKKLDPKIIIPDMEEAIKTIK